MAFNRASHAATRRARRPSSVAGVQAAGAGSVNEVVHRLHDEHEENRDQLHGQRLSVRASPEGGVAQKAGREDAAEVEVADAGQQEDGDRDPAHDPELFPDAGEQVPPQVGRLDLSEDGRPHDGQEEHAPQPQQCCEKVDRDVDVIEGRHGRGT